MLGQSKLALEKHTYNFTDCVLYLLIPGLYWQDTAGEGRWQQNTGRDEYRVHICCQSKRS